MLVSNSGVGRVCTSGIIIPVTPRREPDL